MENEVSLSVTKRDLDAKARQFMVDTYGTPNECEDKDKWYERFGMMLDFISQLYEHKI